MIKSPFTEDRSENTNRTRRDNRGQVIILTTIIVAVSFLSLIAALNGMLFADYLETKPTAVQLEQASSTTDTLTHELDEFLIRMNDEETTTPETNVRTELGVISDNIIRQQAAESSRYVDVESPTNLRTGYLIRQTSERAFTSSNGNPNWLVASPEDVRRFRVSVDRADLPSIPAGNRDNQIQLRMKALTIVTEGDGDVWRLYIYQSGGEVWVSTQTNNGPITATSSGATSAEIGVTTGTINGDHVFEFGPSFSSNPDYRISYRNGDRASGEYTLTVSGAPNTLQLNNGGSNPYYTDGVYSMTIPITFSTQSTTYTETVIINPCAPGDTACPVQGITTEG